MMAVSCSLVMLAILPHRQAVDIRVQQLKAGRGDHQTDRKVKGLKAIDDIKQSLSYRFRLLCS